MATSEKKENKPVTVIFIQCSEIWWKLINVRNQFIKNYHVVQTFQIYCRHNYSLFLIAMWLHCRWTGWYERHRLFKVCRCCLRQWHSVGRESKKRWTRRRGEGKWDDSVKVISVSWLRRRSEGTNPCCCTQPIKTQCLHACSPLSLPPGWTVCPPPTVLAHKLMVASRMERWLEPSLNKVYIDVFKV